MLHLRPTCPRIVLNRASSYRPLTDLSLLYLVILSIAVPVDTIYCCLPVHYIGFKSHLCPSNTIYIFYLPVATCTSHARNQIPHLPILYILWCSIFLNLPNTLNRNRITPPAFYYHDYWIVYRCQSFNKILPSPSIIELCISKCS